MVRRETRVGAHRAWAVEWIPTGEDFQMFQLLIPGRTTWLFTCATEIPISEDRRALCATILASARVD